MLTESESIGRFGSRGYHRHALPAPCAYNVGMDSIQYTVRGVRPELDAELRRESRTSGKSLNALVLETLEQAKLPSAAAVHDDLDWFLGSASADAGEFDTAQTWLDALPAEPA
jgi:hypothetical protein